MAVLKRSREIEDREVETLAMANCLMLLSAPDVHVGSGGHSTTSNGNGRVFRCKTCDREFQSFQALGGHRASHKKPKLLTPLDLFHSPDHQKRKTHGCSICGLEFAVGQALGGHMRRHRGEGTVEEKIKSRVDQSAADAVVPVIRKSNSKRVLCLDLNLMPYENDLKFEYQAAPFLQLGF